MVISPSKNARQRRLDLVRNKKRRLDKENAGDLSSNVSTPICRSQRDVASSSSLNPLTSIENDLDYVNGMQSRIHGMHQTTVPGDIFRRRKNFFFANLPDIEVPIIDSQLEVGEDILFAQGETEVCLDFGAMTYSCQDCGAMVWFEERSEKKKTLTGVKFSICCMKGKVKVKYLSRPPDLLWNLIYGVDSRSSHFLENIRSYNSMFAFTSLGGKVQSGVNSGHGPPQFILGGQNYHRIGSLLPSEGCEPKFAQLYIYDTENEVANRMSHFRSNRFCNFYGI